MQQRPDGVTVIAVLDFIGAGFQALLAVLLFVGGAFVGTILGRLSGQSSGALGAGVGIAIGAVLGVICLVFAAISAAVGYGLWTMKEWGRILQVVLAAVGGLLQVFGLLSSVVQGRMLALGWNVIWVAYFAWVLFYLLQPQIKAAFSRQQVGTYVPPPTAPMA